ncbi:DAK2 domain-containing protein [Paenibacillus mendelii]|uniref:DAK2 domain-containing protein n=1 Tax=Paenibacillus mendelii TaxID=206163 RepID=A0ABV6J506_9BACL|nr:DAK2 domain-containing protein [Paenibacillus mendelii]MCQ6560340.1 DAK2 domain-containing protein [Paenibacillus mendelii]
MLSKRFINGSDFTGMVHRGAECLQRNVERVNALNVFPVPDGDTGTNMNLTMTSGVQELVSKPSPAIGKVSEAFSKGLLMGARGNSGVILSQLFRGFSRSLAGQEEVNTLQLAAALQHGVDMAYKAVVKPVEGTILTVAKEAAKHAVSIARRTTDVVEMMREVHDKAYDALQRTPDLLPVLKQVGVVDSGGQGLVHIYEGFVLALGETGVTAGQGNTSANPTPTVTSPGERTGYTVFVPQQPSSAQSRLSTEAIEYLYDMEFFINRKLAGRMAAPFDEAAFKRALAKDGDSILVIADDEIIKVHVHSRKPGDVLNYALPYGELTDIHILNMREQHRGLLHEESIATDSQHISGSTRSIEDEALGMTVPEVLTGAPVDSVPVEQAHEWAPYGIIAVAMGQGISNIFLDNNVDIVLSGGQTMNPSTEDFVKAIEALHAQHIYLLPNNGNIILAAQQAVELCERNITVIPTRTVPQGLAAVLAFRDEETAPVNTDAMEQAAKQVRSGQVTHAVRDTTIDGIDIREGDFIGILEKSIVASSPDLQQSCRDLLSRMMEEGGELVTILTGEQADAAETSALSEWIESTYLDAELEVHAGGQPLYPYLFAVE